MILSVAMCTYNGAQYLQQQLDSIAEQTRLPDELIICDDGSRDETVSIIKKFADHAPFPVQVYHNDKNHGVVENFSKAIALCVGDLIAFSDQDDVWLPRKLAAAEKRIKHNTEPLSTVYCSRLQYVDSALEPLGFSPIPSNIGFQNAVVENIAIGCSVVFGSNIRKLFLKAESSNMVMHDWWVYLIASAFGQVIYDPEPHILYRQHGGNFTGLERKPYKIVNRTKQLVRRLLTKKVGTDSINQAMRFINTYSDIVPEKRMIVEELIRLRNLDVLSRARYVLHPKIERNDATENFGLKLMLLMGWH